MKKGAELSLQKSLNMLLRESKGCELKMKQNTQKMSPELKKMAPIIVKILRKNDVLKAGIFGSYARGEQKKRSDIDILIQFKGSKSLLDLVRIERELSVKLHRKVDLLTYRGINPFLKERILHEEVGII